MNQPILVGNDKEKKISINNYDKSYEEGYIFYEFYATRPDELEKKFGDEIAKKYEKEINSGNIPKYGVYSSLLQTNDINDTHYLKNIKIEKDTKFLISWYDIFGSKEFINNESGWLDKDTPIFYNENYLTLIQ